MNLIVIGNITQQSIYIYISMRCWATLFFTKKEHTHNSCSLRHFSSLGDPFLNGNDRPMA